MAFYGKLTLVESFTYQKLLAEVYRTMRGGHCEKCDLDHEPADKICSSCNDPITPSEVYLIKVSGQDVGIECASKDEAKEIAKAWIDDLLDGDKPDDEEDKLLANVPPKRRGRKRQAWNQPGGGPRNDRLLEQVKKMGWGRKAIQILRGRN